MARMWRPGDPQPEYEGFSVETPEAREARIEAEEQAMDDELLATLHLANAHAEWGVDDRLER